MIRRCRLAALLLLALPLGSGARARADDPKAAAPPAEAAPRSVAEILAGHDRALMRALDAYLAANPKAADRDQAFMVLFERSIENDWYVETEAAALRYLAEQPDGPVAPLARIVATMARARQKKFDEALAVYRKLMKGLTQPDQEEFAANFADSLAGAATEAGQHETARQVYELLLEQFGDSPNLRAKVRDDLARLERVGKPAPTVIVRDLNGQTLRLSDLKGKYVLLDFWATWCNPCVADLPNVRSAYDKYHPKGFEVVAVSLDESPQAVSDFVQARQLPWRQVHHATCQSDLVAAFGISSIPASFLIGPDGTVLRLNLRGPALGDTLGALIR